VHLWNPPKEVGEGSFVAQAPWVVAGCDEKRVVTFSDLRLIVSKVLASFSCLLTRNRPLIRTKYLVNGLFLVEVAGFEPTQVQTRMPRSSAIQPFEQGKHGIRLLPAMTITDRNSVSFGALVSFSCHEISHFSAG
jgi:hypothetical protein